jgi:hypothetical protein
MSLNRLSWTKLSKETYEVVCDGRGCEEAFNVTDTFQEVVKEIKRHGWKITKIGEDWVHECKDCQKN